MYGREHCHVKVNFKYKSSARLSDHEYYSKKDIFEISKHEIP